MTAGNIWAGNGAASFSVGSGFGQRGRRAQFVRKERATNLARLRHDALVIPMHREFRASIARCARAYTDSARCNSKTTSDRELRDEMWRWPTAARDEQAEVEGVFSLGTNQGHLQHSFENVQATQSPLLYRILFRESSIDKSQASLIPWLSKASGNGIPPDIFPRILEMSNRCG